MADGRNSSERLEYEAELLKQLFKEMSDATSRADQRIAQQREIEKKSDGS